MIIKLAKVFYRWTIPHLSLYTEKIYNLCKIAAETEHDYTVCVYGKNSRLHHHHTSSHIYIEFMTQKKFCVLCCQFYIMNKDIRKENIYDPFSG